MWNGDGNEKHKINVEVSIKTEPADTEPAIVSTIAYRYLNPR